MAVLIQKNFTTSCPGELLDYINNDVTITTELLQIVTVNDGSPQTTDFWFNSTLSGAESTRLDEILFTEGSPKGWTCLPLSANMIDEQEFRDDAAPNSDVIWSSGKLWNLYHIENIGSGNGLFSQRNDSMYGSPCVITFQIKSISDSTGINIAPSENTLTITTNDSQIIHDNLSGFVNDEHINHSDITLTAGAGLSGGGNITSSRTFNINVQNSIEISSDSLQLVNDSASPGNEKVYGTNSSGVKGWYDQASTNGNPLPTIQARRTSTYNDIPTSWTDLTFNTTDVENEPTIIEHNDTNIDDIDIKEDGMYLLHYNLNSDHDIGGRIRINDSTVIPGSTKSVGVQMPYVSNVFMGNSVSVVANLTAGQKLTVQIQAYASSQNLQANSTFIVTKLQGAKGEKGDPGSGSTIEIENDDSSINSTTSTLNFEGSGVAVADEGNGKVTATISGGVYGQNFQHNAVDTTSSTTSENYQQKVSITTGSLDNGTYRIGWFIETANNNSSGRTEIRVQINNSTTLCESSIEAEDSNDWVPFSGFYHASLSGSKTIDLDYRRGNNRGTTSVRNARLEIWRVS